MLICIAQGLSATCKEARAAYKALKTPFDGVAFQPVQQNPQAWIVRGGKNIQEISTKNETINNPYRIRIVRHKSKAGCPVVVLFVYGKTGSNQLHECASRISARNFVSFFSTKDAHNTMWKALHQLTVTPGDKLDASNSLLPLVNTTSLLWPHIYPATETVHNGLDDSEAVTSGNVAVRVPRDVDHACLQVDDENLEAVFGDDLLSLAGKHDTYATLNSVPFVFSVDTPVRGFPILCSRPDNDAYQRKRVKFMLEREKSRVAQLQSALSKPRRKSFNEANGRIKRLSLLLTKTMSNGALPMCMKPHETEHAEITERFVDARYAAFDSQTDTNSDGSED